MLVDTGGKIFCLSLATSVEKIINFLECTILDVITIMPHGHTFVVQQNDYHQ